uniref:Uncharacterized protein n=1 Tax=Oncorhynchus kisutch TaxID=8019 RepID=A0A8C7D311_ONCKI
SAQGFDLLQYKLGEKTEARLQEKGARCIEEVTIREHYYDTESFHLASQQTWLSKQGSQWRMIIGPYLPTDHVTSYCVWLSKRFKQKFMARGQLTQIIKYLSRLVSNPFYSSGCYFHRMQGIMWMLLVGPPTNAREIIIAMPVDKKKSVAMFTSNLRQIFMRIF